MTMNAEIDTKMLEEIDQLRLEFRACTARHLASRLRFNNTYISQRLHLLKARGLVDFDPKVPGSIRRTNTMEINIGDAVPTVVESAQTIILVEKPTWPDELLLKPAVVAMTAAQIRMAKVRAARRQKVQSAQSSSHLPCDTSENSPLRSSSSNTE